MNDVLRMIRERGVNAGSLQLCPEHLAEIIHMIERKKITTSTGKALLVKVEESGRKPQEIVEDESLAQVSDDETLRSLASEILSDNPEQVATYKGGKTTVIGWFVGQVMQKTRGKANPQMAKVIFEELLSENGHEEI
jgi:aspartyl-tRNA(Asn)/glutamyl-tRNA(Gln) amidotransferase subunit B